MVLYRIPLSSRASNQKELTKLIRLVLVDQIASTLSIPPDEVDSDFDPNGF
ncbi:hypothetical protein HMPREF3198_01405 [Winkia neuii]|nr:hypothetical protein HMPREF3198_01405 [Winkia neuii]